MNRYRQASAACFIAAGVALLALVGLRFQESLWISKTAERYLEQYVEQTLESADFAAKKPSIRVTQIIRTEDQATVTARIVHSGEWLMTKLLLRNDPQFGWMVEGVADLDHDVSGMENETVQRPEPENELPEAIRTAYGDRDGIIIQRF